jgi:hypothetical protein
MAFDRLEVREKSGRSGLPASVSLSCLNGGRPAVMVAITEALIAGAGFAADSRFHALIGRDDDAGKIRIERADDGLLAPRLLKSNSMLLNLGYVEAIGTEAHKKQFTSARVIADGVVEIDLPPFDSDTREPPAQLLLPAPSPARAPAANGGGAGKKASPLPGETLNGITIDMTEDNESVTFKGKTTEVTTRQAKLVRLLARPRPEPVGEAFLIKSLWGLPAPKDVKDQLRVIAGDLQKGLSPIGLNLVPVRGVGYQLKDL